MKTCPECGRAMGTDFVGNFEYMTPEIKEHIERGAKETGVKWSKRTTYRLGQSGVWEKSDG